MGIIYTGWKNSSNPRNRMNCNYTELERIHLHNDIYVGEINSPKTLSTLLKVYDLVINSIRLPNEKHYFIYKNTTSLSESEIALVCDINLLQENYIKKEDEIIISMWKRRK